MAYNPSIHTASNKAYGVTGKPVDARYWFFDSGTYSYRPYASTAEVFAYLIANDRKGATVQVGAVEYWWPDVSDLTDGGLVVKGGTYVIEEVIPSGIDFTYAYGGGLGNNPLAYVQERNFDDSGWVTNSAMVNIQDDGTILAQGDFSVGTFRLVVRG